MQKPLRVGLEWSSVWHICVVQLAFLIPLVVVAPVRAVRARYFTPLTPIVAVPWELVVDNLDSNWLRF